MNLSLTGTNILITSPEHQARVLSTRLRDLGACVIALPMIEILPPSSWDELDWAIRNLTSYDWIFFASKNAVHYFIERSRFLLPEAAGDVLKRMVQTRLAAIGENTAQVLVDHGLKVDYFPTEFHAESFVRGFPQYPNLSGVRVLWPRTNIGTDSIARKMAQAGCHLTIVESYRTTLPQNKEELSCKLDELLQERKLDLITFSSGQTARNFAQILAHSHGGLIPSILHNGDDSIFAGREFKNMLKSVTLVSIGPETSAAMKECGLPVCLEAKAHNAEGLVKAILQYMHRKGVTDHAPRKE